MTDIDRI